MTRAGQKAALATLALLAACAPKPAPRPVPTPAPAPAPAPAPPRPVPPAPTARDWRDVALTPGAWRYGVEDNIVLARFAAADGSGFVLSCDRASRQIALTREGAAAGGAMTIRTTFSVRAFAAAQARLAASDPFLDSMVFSRGRISVEVAGLPSLILPAWPEPARVVEDCRR